MIRYLLALLVASVALAQVPAAAHHSLTADYLTGQLVTIQGEITEFVFRNPHSFVHVLVTEADGTRVRYAVEWSGCSQLAGRISGTTLKPGDYLVITGHPGRKAADRRVRLVSLQRPKDGFAWRHRKGDVLG